MATEPLVVCDNLVKIYRVGDHDVVALQGLDLVVGTGELLGLVGVSGSGKTSLLNILGGLDHPTTGRVRAAGHDLLRLSGPALDRYRLHQVGFVWQQAGRNLVPYLTALQNVILPLTLAGVVGSERERRARALLTMVDMQHRLGNRLDALSGGEQQRVAIAVALANEPVLLLADEPTGEVDEQTARQIYEILQRLNREQGLTVLIVSHDTMLAHWVDRVVNIRDGKISSETVRGKVAPIPSVEAEAQQLSLTELTVLDAAGRLQVPRPYLEQLGIRRRVRLELTTEGVLIRPAAAAEGTEESAELLVDRLDAHEKRQGWTNRLQRWLQGNRHD